MIERFSEQSRGNYPDLNIVKTEVLIAIRHEQPALRPLEVNDQNTGQEEVVTGSFLSCVLCRNQEEEIMKCATFRANTLFLLSGLPEGEET
ncbi:unnamed protein product [Boreogadus saida]